ncbi:MAG TPA: polysaccharide biosynthesis/export family protein [Candidatus Acidoferrum sp.]|nr:polysaccharide biosynthesis/export family protein [Candidatus Acidoferrum sp.]
MQPTRLRAVGCIASRFVWGRVSGLVSPAVTALVTWAMLALLPLTPPCRAQAGRPSGLVESGQPILETPQQVNNRIRELSANLRMMPHDYVIGPGDLLGIYVFDVEELSRDVRVSQTGTIGIPLVPVRIHVAGLTEIQTGQKIAELLEVNGLVTHADVSVSVKEHKSKPITVVGAVAHPMVYEADRSVTLLEVLAEAGGISNDAGDTIIVSRPSQDEVPDSGEPPEIGPEQTLPAKVSTTSTADVAAPRPSTASQDATKDPASAALPSASGAAAASPPSASNEPPPVTNTITINLSDAMETGDMKNNIALQAGDVVTVPHAGVVYVLGAVGRAGGYVLSNDRTQLTTLKILSLAGGLTRTAKTDKAVIVRKDNMGQQHEMPVDLKKVLSRKAEDLQLQPSDILYVPESGSKQAFFRAMEFGLALGSGVALYRLAYR